MLSASLIAAATILLAQSSGPYYQTLPSAYPEETILPKVRTRTIKNPKAPQSPELRAQELKASDTYWNFRKGIVPPEYKALKIGEQPPNRIFRGEADPIAAVITRRGPPSRVAVERLWRYRQGESSIGAKRWRMRYLGDIPGKPAFRVDIAE